MGPTCGVLRVAVNSSFQCPSTPAFSGVLLFNDAPFLGQTTGYPLVVVQIFG